MPGDTINDHMMGYIHHDRNSPVLHADACSIKKTKPAYLPYVAKRGGQRLYAQRGHANNPVPMCIHRWRYEAHMHRSPARTTIPQPSPGRGS